MGWVFFAVLCLLELIADVFAKQHVVSNQVMYAVLAVAGYVLGNTAWIFALRKGVLLSIGASFFGVVTGGAAILVGIGLYKEAVTRTQMVGVVLGIVSSVLLASGGRE